MLELELVLALALALAPFAASVTTAPTRVPTRAPTAAPVTGTASALPLPWARGAGNDVFGTGHAALPSQVGLASNTSGWYFPTSGPIFTSPAIDGSGAIYVVSNDSYLYALNASGTYLWSFGLPSPYGFGSFSSPALSPSGGTVYVGSESGYLLAVTAASGAQAWALKLRGGGQIVDGAPVAATVGGATTVFVCSYEGNGTFAGALTAVTDGGTQPTVRWVFAPAWGACYSAPAVDVTATYVYAIFLR